MRKNKTGKIYCDERNILKQDAPHQHNDPFIDEDPPQPQPQQQQQVVGESPQEVVPPPPPQQVVAPTPPPPPPLNICTPMQSLKAFKRKMALYDTSALDAKDDGFDFGV